MLSRSAWIGVIVALGLGAAALVWSARERAREATRPPWPAAAGDIHAPTLAFPSDFGVRRVAVDPGHGARNNTGNVSCFCVDEEATTLEAAGDLAAELEATGHFEVLLTRRDDRPVEYKDRLSTAEAWGAEAFISLHSDVRGHAIPRGPETARTCRMSFSAPGYAVLYSDEGDAELAGRRRALARQVALSMASAALLPFEGGYEGLYDADGETPGVFVDRHAMDQRIFVLRRAAMPSIIVETHNALDPREAVRWGERPTRHIFAAAIAAALVAALDGSPAKSAR